VWKGPPYLTLMPALRSEYPHLKKFFQDQLGIEDAPPDIIVKELQHFSSSFDKVKLDSPEFNRLTRLLRYASRSVDQIREGELKDWTSNIRACALFPVDDLSGDPDAPLKLVAATDLFYVPDLGGHLHTLFRDVAPFLAFDSQQLVETTSFLQHVGVLPGKGVERCVSQTIEIDGQPLRPNWDGPVNDGDSQYFNERWPYLQRFVLISGPTSFC